MTNGTNGGRVLGVAGLFARELLTFWVVSPKSL